MLGNVEKPLVSESRRDLLLEYCLISLQKNERIKDIYGENTCDKLKFPSIGERMKKKKRKHKKNRYFFSQLNINFFITTEKKTSAGKRSSTGRKGPHRHFLIENLFPSHHYQLVGLAERPSTILGSVLSSFQASEGDTNVELHSYQVRNGNKYGPKSVCSAADQRAQVHCCACWEPFAPL